jgi:hypothetical protein
MLKKTRKGLAVLVVLLAGAIFWFLYADDSVVATLSPVPEGGVRESLYVQTPGKNTRYYPLITTHGLVPVRVLLSQGAAHGGEGVFVKSTEIAIPMLNDERTFAVLKGSAFHNGSIEVELNGTVSPNVSRLTRLFARGFIGICFRISKDMSSAECLYLRPENGQAKDATRRNHAVQYVAMPDWGFARLRKQAPGKYEAAANIRPGTWHKIRIEVKDEAARLFIDDGKMPVLVVSDLKLGADRSGRIGLWVGPGTNGLFRNLTMTRKE